MQHIPTLDLSSEIEGLWDELNAAIQGVLRSGRFIMGPNVQAFESEMADYLGVKHAIAVNSGTDALTIGLRALGIGPGDEVITSPFTFFATAESIHAVGALPVFVDIDPQTYNIDPNLIEQHITPRTRAILPVHLYGQAAAMEPLHDIAERHRLVVLEDVAQAIGGTYAGQKLGTLGQVGAFSFFPSKNLGAYGDGGLITAHDDEVAATARMLRVHGARRKYHNEMIGYNSRLDELQAAILRVKLPHLERWNRERRRVAARYTAQLEDVPGIVPPSTIPEAVHVYHQYTIRIQADARDNVQQRLADMGIATMIYYPTPVHKLPLYTDHNLTLPHAEAAAGAVLSLPIWPDMPEDVQDRVIAALRSASVTRVE